MNMENKTRQNVFKSKDSGTSKRNMTGKSLSELAESSQRNNSNNHHRRGRRNNDRRMFIRPAAPPPPPQFEIKKEEFPELVEGQEANIVKPNDYIEKLKKIEEEKQQYKSKLPKGWIKLPIENLVIEKKEPVSEYYNPTNARKILQDRLEYREELNDILGHMSPYWDMLYPNELEDDDYEDNSDESEDSDEEYVEDW